MAIKTNSLLFSLAIAVGCLALSLDFVKAQTGTDYLKLDVSVSLVTNLVGHIQRVSTVGNEFTTGGIRYVNNQNIVVNIGASTLPTISSIYLVTGNIFPSGTGAQTGTYTFDQANVLQSGDGMKILLADYETLWGIYHTGEVRVFLDQTGPTKPYINFMNGAVFYNYFNIHWSGGYIDTGVGFDQYMLHIALDPDFLSEVLIPVSGEMRSFQINNLPLGTIRWYLESVDYLGNATPSDVFYFHNQLPSYNSQGSTYIPIPLQENYTVPPHDTQHTVTTEYKPVKRKLTQLSNAKLILLDQFTHSTAVLHRLLPTTSPKTGVDVEEFVKDSNDYIWKITHAPTQSPLWYQIVLGLMLILICLYNLKAHYWKKNYHEC